MTHSTDGAVEWIVIGAVSTNRCAGHILSVGWTTEPQTRHARHAMGERLQR